MGWPDRRLLDLLHIDVPIVQAPMAGPGTPQLAIAVSEAGGLGSLPCSQLDVAQTRDAIAIVRGGTTRPFNLNFFCHTAPGVDAAAMAAWQARLAPFYIEHGLDPRAPLPPAARRAFDHDYCLVIEDLRPAVASFHFGLPEAALVARVKAAGTIVLGSATTVAEARWLEAHGCDAIIAMGLDAGGHRGNFLSADVARQVGTFALVPQVADAVRVPVIAAGGIGDARGIVAALALGASAVQIGTAYLFCPEANLSAGFRRALDHAADDDTVITNVFTGRPARGLINRLIREVGPVAPDAPAFPLAAAAVAPLRAKAEADGSTDFSAFLCGQAAPLGRALPAGELTRALAHDARGLLSGR